MLNENDINKIVKTIENHEQRIIKLEGLNNQSNQKHATTKKKESISDHLNKLKSDGFFNTPKLVKEIVSQLAIDGFHYPPESLTSPLQRVVRKRELGRIKKDNKWVYCKR